MVRTHTHTHTHTHTQRQCISVCLCLSAAVVDVEDSGELVGSLTVSVEGLEALRDIMEDEDKERAPVPS